jgi:hypothetical protein
LCVTDAPGPAIVFDPRPWEVLAGPLDRAAEELYRSAQGYGYTWTMESPAAVDCAADVPSGPHSDNQMHVLYVVCGSQAAAAGDFAHSLALLLRSPRTVYGQAAVARGPSEHAARLWYVLEPNLEPIERVRRYLNERLYSMHEQLNIIEALGELDPVASPTEESRQQLTARIHEILRWAEKIGLASVQDRTPRRSGLPATPQIGKQRPSATALHEQALIGLGALSYRLACAVTHAVGYAISNRLERPPVDQTLTQPTMRPQQAALEHLYAPLMLIKAGDRLHQRMGWASNGWSAAARDLGGTWWKAASGPGRGDS